MTNPADKGSNSTNPCGIKTLPPTVLLSRLCRQRDAKSMILIYRVTGGIPTNSTGATMSSSAAPRCQHIKVSGTQCGSPALRQKSFCFYHQQNRPLKVDCYYKPDEYSTGEIDLPPFEDAHSIQTVIRQVVQMVLQQRLERKTASLLLYAIQIASSSLKRMDQEKPQPAEVVIDPETMETGAETPLEATNQDRETGEVNDSRHAIQNEKKKNEKSDSEDVPPGNITIQACYQPDPQMRIQPRASHQRKKQYVI